MKRSMRFVLSSGVVAATGTVLFLAGFYPAVGQGQEKGAGQPKPDNRESVKLISGYKNWTKVNPKPVLMQPAPATQCRNATPDQLPSPHLQKYIYVYVNKVGKEAMMHQKTPSFPVGTIIVKEKLSNPDSKSPELMTVMVKRDKAYNPESGDWEYMVFDGTGKKVEAQGKLEKCQSCHSEAPAKQADYVFRDYYLPHNLKTALR
ncbi:MAG TPA: cytochrome P460 family protein [Chthonomonadaceae bacterium]|nr:cytochrome P460 family protein [Chthonomonadaceae bacterium]